MLNKFIVIICIIGIVLCFAILAKAEASEECYDTVAVNSGVVSYAEVCFIGSCKHVGPFATSCSGDAYYDGDFIGDYTADDGRTEIETVGFKGVGTPGDAIISGKTSNEVWILQ